MNQTLSPTLPAPFRESARKLQNQLKGRVILPVEPEYDTARLAWNRNVEQFPAIIVVAKSADDVRTAVRFARQHRLGIAVQSTGHGNVRPADDCLLLLTHKMNEVHIDPQQRTARVGAGALWGSVLAAAQEYGLAPLLGSSPGVGAVGYTLGGGLGWLGRKYGLSTDNVIAFEVVTADGELRTVSADENSDLFWGMRGGGGSLAIVTAMTIRLFPVTDVYAGNLYYPADMAREVFRRYRNWIADAPEELTTSVVIMHYPPLPELPDFLRGRSYVIVRGCYCGSIAEGERLLGYWRDWLPPQIDDFKTIPFSEAAVISSDPMDPLPGFTSGAWLRELSDTTIDILIQSVLSDDGPRPFMMTEIRHAGGAIRRIPAAEAAYGNRDAELLLALISVAPTAAAYHQLAAQAESLKAAIRPSLTGGVYMNFLEGIESQERIQDGLAEGAYQRLSQLKQRVDPDNILRFSFNIRLNDQPTAVMQPANG